MVAKQSSPRFGAPGPILVLVGVLTGCGPRDVANPEPESPAPPTATFVGGDACAACHAEQLERWRGSHHDLAMQQATEASVLGDFDSAEFSYAGRTTRFYRRDSAYIVSTEGPEGLDAEFEVSHTFGVEPLQQYLIGIGDGKVQALSIAWDARPESEGGQRWFHLYADEAIDASDPLHWTGIYQRWNTMCADCHSTALEKRYDSDRDRFDTRWQSIDVDCESCHGPGSAHVLTPAVPPPALPARQHRWEFSGGASIASRVPAASGASEIEVCAPCHSLRTQLAESHQAGDAFLDTYRPSLLDAGSYHADGQILGEVYVYGSFLQSAMAAAGVSCSDCHEPHSTGLRAEGNALCAQCHLPSSYDVPEHHRHQFASAGSQCVACHMRAETYMVIDPRRDHSFRVPRPDLAATLGSPNACNDCHADQSSEWAAAQVGEWFPEGRQNQPHFGQALAAARAWAADARPELVALIADTGQPAIARATALGLLPRFMTAEDLGLLQRSLEDAEPIVRLAAVEATLALPPAARVDLVQRFLTDDRLALRVAAARSLAAARGGLSARRQDDFDRALGEYLEAQAINADRPEGVLNAAAVQIDQGRYAEAEELLSGGVARFPLEPALAISLADVYQQTGRGPEALELLRGVTESGPGNPSAALALGFALVRAGQPEQALVQFERAAAAAPDEPEFQYVLAVAENDSGAAESAVSRLRAAHQRFPGHADTLFALATMLRDAGAGEEALNFARELAAARPGDQSAVTLLRELEQRL